MSRLAASIVNVLVLVTVNVNGINPSRKMKPMCFEKHICDCLARSVLSCCFLPPNRINEYGVIKTTI
ncbi:hypothetical protein JCM14469_06420 [Desulfatiferula olefinivorans]